MPCRQPRLATVLLGKLKEDQLPSDALKLLRNMRLVRMEPRTQPCVEIAVYNIYFPNNKQCHN